MNIFTAIMITILCAFGVFLVYTMYRLLSAIIVREKYNDVTFVSSKPDKKIIADLTKKLEEIAAKNKITIKKDLAVDARFNSIEIIEHNKIVFQTTSETAEDPVEYMTFLAMNLCFCMTAIIFNGVNELDNTPGYIDVCACFLCEELVPSKYKNYSKLISYRLETLFDIEGFKMPNDDICKCYAVVYAAVQCDFNIIKSVATDGDITWKEEE